MPIASLLALTAVAADDHSVLAGEICYATGACSPYSMDLYPSGRVADSLGRIGTYTLVAVRGSADRVLTWNFPDEGVRGEATEGPQNCWAEPGPPVNPAIGMLNVCLTSDNTQLLRPYDVVCDGVALSYTYPLDEEDDHWAAGRLTPEYPAGMWVHAIEYSLVTTDPDRLCGGLDHRVQLFLGDAAASPDNTPVVLQEFDVLGSELAAGDILHKIVLPDSIFVTGNQSLFVSLEMPIERSGRMCPAVCQIGPQQLDQSYWSNSALTPYAWQDLDDWDIRPLMIRGRVLYASE